MTDEFLEAMKVRRLCRFCGHEFVTADANMRAVPQAPRDGIPVTMLVPRCPKCDKPFLYVAAETSSEVVSR